MEEVDGFLDAVHDTFLGVRQPPLTAEEIRAKRFAVTLLRLGYDEQEVDAFLEDARSEAAGEMCRVRGGDWRRGSGLRRVRGSCRGAAVCGGGPHT